MVLLLKKCSICFLDREIRFAYVKMLNIFSVQFRLTEVPLLNLARKIHILGPKKKKKDAVDPAFSTWTPHFPLGPRVFHLDPVSYARPRVFYNPLDPVPRTPAPRFPSSWKKRENCDLNVVEFSLKLNKN